MTPFGKYCLSFAFLPAVISFARTQELTRTAVEMEPALLLQREEVRKELKITDNQLEKLQQLTRMFRDKHKNDFQNARNRNGSREERQKLINDFSKEAMRAISEVLDVKQMQRLRQLHLQQQAEQAFHSEDVQRHLRLTATQKSQIQKIVNDFTKERRELLQGSKENVKETFQKLIRLRKLCLRKILNLFSDEQRAVWNEMVGSPFEFRTENKTTEAVPNRSAGPNEK